MEVWFYSVNSLPPAASHEPRERLNNELSKKVCGTRTGSMLIPRVKLGI